MWISPSITGLDCRLLLRRTTTNRLTRSTSDVVLAFPNFLRKLDEVAFPVPELFALGRYGRRAAHQWLGPFQQVVGSVEPRVWSRVVL